MYSLPTNNFLQYINGELVAGQGRTTQICCPGNGEPVAQVALASGIPVMFGVLTTENIEQAVERAGTKAGNKGYDCALGAIEMINLMKEIEG